MIVWLASYPRSGNTFLRVLLNQFFNIKTHSIYNDLKDIASDKSTRELVGHLHLSEDVQLDEIRNSKNVFYIKTHDGPGCVEGSDKVIYLIRDGRDSSLSYLNYLRRYQDEPVTVQDVYGGQVMFGSWASHVEEWEGGGVGGRSLLVRFEVMVDNPMVVVEELSQFLGKNPAEGKPPSFDALQQVNSKFFFRGQSDYWKSDLNDEEQLIFWMCNYAPMIKYGYREGCPRIFQEKEFLEFLLALDSNKFVVNEEAGFYEYYANILYQISLALKGYQGRVRFFSDNLKLKNSQLLEKEKVINGLKSDVAYGEAALNSLHSVLVESDTYSDKESIRVELLALHKVEKDGFNLLLEDLVEQLNTQEAMLNDERSFHSKELQIIRNLHAGELDELRVEEQGRYDGMVKKVQEEHDMQVGSLIKSYTKKTEISNGMISQLEGTVVERDTALNKMAAEKSQVDLWVLKIKSYVQEFSSIRFSRQPLKKIKVFRKLIKFVFKGYIRD